MKALRRVIRIIIALAIVLAGLLLYSNLAITYSRYEKSSAKLPEAFEGFKIALLSDLHNKSFGKDNATLISMLDSEKPDVIVIAGDMVNSTSSDFSVFYSLAEQLAPRYETYYAYGNHEERFPADVLAEFDSRLAGYGVNIINNSYAKITRQGESIDLFGLRLPMYYYSPLNEEGGPAYDLSADTMNGMLGTADSSRFTMLLAHNPVFFETYAEWGADIAFSGHIHGGVIRLPFIGGLFSPAEKYFPKYDGGEYLLGENTLVLSRGLGEHVAPVRLFNPADICIITLTRK